jgi:glucose-6-phosphate isomerase, archaeal
MIIMNQTDPTHSLDPFSIDLDLENGLFLNPKRHLVRRASDMRGYYSDPDALEELIERHQDPVHYEVFELPVPEQRGHLMYCISALQPGKVGREFFMTKGHYHQVIDTAEVYLGLRGEGYLLMKTADGRCATEKISRGRMVYVPPFWAHRSINTGSEPLISFCVYPAEAGHNYGDIAEEGFPKRIFEQNGQSAILADENKTRSNLL